MELSILIMHQTDDLFWNNILGMALFMVQSPIHKPSIIQKGKAMRVGAGALAGGLINPVGAVVGATMSAASGGRSKTSSVSNTTQFSRPVEINSQAELKIREISTNRIFTLYIVCNSRIDSVLRGFFERSITADMSNQPLIPQKAESPSLQNRDVEELKKFKELLDMGIITQEEFDKKKKDILHL